MAAVGRGSSAGVLAPVTVHISAATFPIACVDSVPPVPGRAGKLRSLTDVPLVLENGADSRESWTRFLQSIGRDCGGMQDSAGHGSRPEP